MATFQSTEAYKALKEKRALSGLRAMRQWLRVRRRFWREYWYGEPELRELLKWTDRGKAAIDIGGNIGIYSYHLSRTMAKVTTFEPNPKYADKIGGLNLKGVRVEPVALSDTTGEVTLRVPRLGTGRVDEGMASIEPGVVPDDAVAQSLDVSMRRLDDYGLTNIGIIKIDVEGHEERVLRGGLETIRANRPVLLIEIEERHNVGGLRRIEERIKALDYRGFFFDKGVRRSLDEFDAERWQRWSPALDNAGHKRGAIAYINNFLFLPSERAN